MIDQISIRFTHFVVLYCDMHYFYGKSNVMNQ